LWLKRGKSGSVFNRFKVEEGIKIFQAAKKGCCGVNYIWEENIPEA